MALQLVAADGPVYSETEQLKIEIAMLKQELHRVRTERDQCRVELTPLRYQRDEVGLRDVMTTLKGALEAAHPGYVFNPQTGQLEPAPVGVPAPAPTPKP